ncbi:putative non-specific serine/threonine protein kinase [Helianthus debilis subsp. tardiflorus]
MAQEVNVTPLPMFIDSMSRLRYLDLSTNFFNGSIPVFIGSMTRSRYLDLSYNSFSGTIPPELGSLKNLHFLSLNSISNCTIENIDWLFHHSHLHHLELDGISLAKANHWLDASSSKFTGSLSDNIQKFSSLEYLSISHNQLNGSISEKVRQLPKLETLDVSSNSLSGAISKSIGTSNIVKVNLSNNSLKGVPSEAYMSNLSSVEQIDLSSCMLGPSFPK